MSGTFQPRVQSSTISSWRGERRRGGRPRGSRPAPGGGDAGRQGRDPGCPGRRARLVAAGALNALADHVDRPDQLAALGRVLGQDQVQVELAGAGLREQPAADLLGAIVPEAGVEPGVPPADGAVPLDVVDQVRLAGRGRQCGEADDQGHGRPSQPLPAGAGRGGRDHVGDRGGFCHLGTIPSCGLAGLPVRPWNRTNHPAEIARDPRGFGGNRGRA